ncbi:MAG: hypothetical protein RLZZ224_124 [Verrucomicrobiota bacterium]|jgi:hypothetical protein
MIRILTLIALAATALVASSCCCTSDAKAPRLKRLPKFRQFPAAPEVAPDEPVVSYEK